ncbi:MAG: chromosome segregation protein SMC, partial [Chlorobiota bacterium]
MYLSRIELHGFKSFADPTILRFSDGLTAIVGPNGSGKTNIIDAIRWVLGEQKTSLLRTDAMNQVIFNGTRARKPLGMAEVSIVIENTQKILPAEFSEVVVTRRLFRDGESQYLLNGSPCRRKDIVDLFTDTGMGADAYSVIELKMVEQILEDHSDERRHLFEEAAGIVKYKQRRKETLAKLDATRTDIERVLDHLTVLRRTVGSLKRQAERAERHAALESELRTLEAERLFRTWYAHQNQNEQLQAQQHALSEQLGMIATVLASDNERITRLSNDISSLERQRDELHELQQQLNAERSTVASQCAVLEERSRATQSALDSLLEQLRSRSRTHDRIESDLESAQAQLAAALEEVEMAEMQATELRVTLDTERQRHNELLSAQAEIAEPLRLLERDRERLATLRTHIRHTAEQLGQRAQRLAAELDAVRTRSGEVDARIRQTAEDRTRAMQTIAELEQELSAAQARKNELEGAIEALRIRRQQLADTASHYRAQRAILESIVEHGELDPAALENAPVRPTVTFGDLLSAPQDVAVALESVLGSIAQYPVVETKREMTLLGGWLRKHLRRKAHLICLELVPKFPPPQPLPHDAPARWLDEHISADEPTIWLLRALLEGIALVDKLESADELFAAYPTIRAVVDRQGQIRTRAGIALFGPAG